jgi:Tfp pilus assembly protein PilF
MSMGKHKPEAWTCAALVDQSKGEYSKALENVDSALAIDPRNFTAHHVRGHILIHLDRVGEACLSFRRAYRISKDISNYEGIK